jgi:hypothetical protein
VLPPALRHWLSGQTDSDEKRAYPGFNSIRSQ